MENRAHALAAGIFTLCLLFAAVAAVWWFGGKREATRDYLVVTRGNVSGLNQQGQVRYRGMRVGRVEAIGIDPADSRDIVVRISVPERLPLTRATVAKLGYQGVTGIAHILLEDGGGEAVPFPEADGLPRIPMQPSFLQDFADSGAATLRQAQTLLASLNEILSGENKARIGRTLANIETGSANLAETMAQTRSLLADPRLKQLGAAVANLDGASADMRRVLAEVAVLVPRMNALVARIDETIGDAEGEGVAAAAARMHELGRELTQTTRQLNRNLRLLEEAPQSVLFGTPAMPPGPGEPGFVPPAASAGSRP